jgi:uncharacterized protein (TIGR00255 family)
VPHGMTGFGRASAAFEGGAVTVEVKTVNNRFLKVSLRLPDVLNETESELESKIRAALRRGSVYCNVQLDRNRPESGYRLNEDSIRAWYPRLKELANELGTEEPKLADLLAMEGVVLEEFERQGADESMKDALMQALGTAIAGVLEMRNREGASLKADMDKRVNHVAELSKGVEKRAPQVVLEYRDKLKARIDRLLADGGTKLEESELAREVAYFADRADVTEETTRLAHHCEQFLKVIAEDGEVGRRLDFIAQEMLRETNTVASKANDAELASIAVTMKSELEKIKEQVQNLE